MRARASVERLRGWRLCVREKAQQRHVHHGTVYSNCRHVIPQSLGYDGAGDPPVPGPREGILRLAPASRESTFGVASGLITLYKS